MVSVLRGSSDGRRRRQIWSPRLAGVIGDGLGHLVSPLGRGDRRRARSSPAPLRGPGREVASSGDGGGCGGDEVGDDGGGLRRVPRRRPSSRTSPPRGRCGALVNVPAVNAVPVTPSSMMPATRASCYTFDPRHPGRIWTAGVWRRWLATHTPFLSLPYSPGENLASVPNERWRRSTSHPPWGTALEKPLRARILSLVYALTSNFSPRP
uniref:Uncharacterized protein n=1 Tax=Oryza rufipogon TaxID=4529 RepID=A0A0E0NLZ1_ORYRU